MVTLSLGKFSPVLAVDLKTLTPYTNKRAGNGNQNSVAAECDFGADFELMRAAGAAGRNKSNHRDTELWRSAIPDNIISSG